MDLTLDLDLEMEWLAYMASKPQGAGRVGSRRSWSWRNRAGAGGCPRALGATLFGVRAPRLRRPRCHPFRGARPRASDALGATLFGVRCPAPSVPPFRGAPAPSVPPSELEQVGRPVKGAPAPSVPPFSGCAPPSTTNATTGRAANPFFLCFFVRQCAWLGMGCVVMSAGQLSQVDRFNYCKPFQFFVRQTAPVTGRPNSLRGIPPLPARIVYTPPDSRVTSFTPPEGMRSTCEGCPRALGATLFGVRAPRLRRLRYAPPRAGTTTTPRTDVVVVPARGGA